MKKEEMVRQQESALNPELVSYTVEYEDGEVKEVIAKDEIQAMEIAGIDMFTDSFGKVVSIKEGKPEQTLELYEIFRERAMAEGTTDYQWFRHNRIQCWAEEACYYFDIPYHTMIEGVEQRMPEELVEIANKIEITPREEKEIMDIIIQVARNIIRQ